MKYLNLKNLNQAQRDEFISIWTVNGLYTADREAGDTQPFCQPWTFGAQIYLSNYADTDDMKVVLKAYLTQYANRIDRQITALLEGAKEDGDQELIAEYRRERYHYERACRFIGVELSRHIFGR